MGYYTSIKMKQMKQMKHLMVGAAGNAAAGRATRPNRRQRNGEMGHARRFSGDPPPVRAASVFLLPLDIIFQLDRFCPLTTHNAAGMTTP